MRYARLTILACLLASVARGQFCALPITQVSGALDIQFISTGHSNGWTAPFITSTLTDSQVTWIAPSGVSTNSKTPALSFFFESGTYSIRATDWSKVSRLCFYAGADARNFLSAIPNSQNTMAQLTGLTTALSMFRYQTRNFAIMANIPIDKWTLCTSMSYAFFGCSGLTGSIRDLSKMTLCESMYAAFHGCSGLTGSISDLSKMTRCTSMGNAFFGCFGLTGNADVFTENMTNLTTSAYCFYNNTSLTGAGSNFINIAKSPSYTVGTDPTNSSYRTFYGCINLTDWATIPAAYK